MAGGLRGRPGEILGCVELIDAHEAECRVALLDHGLSLDDHPRWSDWWAIFQVALGTRESPLNKARNPKAWMLTTEIMLLREIEYRLQVVAAMWASEDAPEPKRIHLDGIPDDDDDHRVDDGEAVEWDEMQALLGW